MERLVIMMLIDARKTPGILRTLKIDAEKNNGLSNCL